MTQKLMKQVVGVDVAQKELVVCLGRLWDDLRSELYASKTVPNDMAGFKALMQWVSKNTDNSIPVSFVLEATGVYHECFAWRQWSPNP
jgi:transposase